MRLLVVARMALPLLVLAMSANIWANPIRTRDSSLVLRIELAERVEVAQAYVKLADIARLHSMELETLRHAMAVPLGSAPRSGETVTLDRARLARWLRAQLGLEASQIQWSGASATQISRSSAEISGNEILAVAQAALRKYLEESLAKYPNARIELLAVGTPASLAVPSVSSTLVVRPLENVPLANRMLVWVDVFTNGQYARSAAVRFELSAYLPAAVAAKRLGAGNVLQAGDWVKSEVDIAQIPHAAISLPTTALRLRHSVESGDVITRSNLEAMPAVSRGDWINLTTQVGAVTLESRAEALQDGALGQLVHIKPVRGTGTVLARVVGPASVEMPQ